MLELIESEINKIKEIVAFWGMFPPHWLPSAVAVLGEGFTEQNKFLNSTLKIVRAKISEYYKPRLDYLFTAEAKRITNHHNKMIISSVE
ncbi:MAG: hypothetical protein K8H86_11720 [Ignavibacteriaceae bacterium]|nr:hypothetical protein [Ignavibacteriaceae bacterium]